jgi:putative ABC transport system ATP-binding protein
MSELAIAARGLTKTYGKGELAYQALRGADLAIPSGEFHMLVGPSGSGKTTLLSILGGVLTATSGDYRLFGEAVTGRPERELPALRSALIGFVFQQHNLVEALEARENVALGARLRGLGGRAALREADRLLERVGLSARAFARPSDLSGGERQRVAIARAVAGAPPLVLADEPTAALDADNGRRATELLREMSRERGATVVVVTHDGRILPLADRISRIEDGRLADGTGGAA